MKISFEKIPQTVAEFKQMDTFSLDTPYRTAALFLLALCRYTQDKEEGIAMINALKGPVVLSNYDISFLKDRLCDKPYLPFSYFEGATKENDYTPTKPLTVALTEDPRGGDEEYVKVFVSSSGADSKRHVEMRKKGEFYYLWTYPGILSDIRKPKKEDPWM